MIKKITNFISLLLFLSSITFITVFYISDKNVNFIKKNRAFYNLESHINLDDLPLLRSDTVNIIEYKDGIKEFKKKKKKYSFWDLLKPDKKKLDE